MAGHPYLLAAIGGLLAQLVMNLYSSGLNLHDLRVRLRRSRTIVIDGAVILLAGAFVMVVQADFSGSWRALSSCSGSKLAILARPGHQEARRRDWRR
jgi:purine-cytosine permease-like protein